MPQLALITGGTSGLGKALAQFLTHKNIPTLLIGHHCESTGNIFSIDLSRKEERKKLLELISIQKPDLIINNAGLGFYGPTVDLSQKEVEEMLEVNIAALVEVSLHAAKVLIEARKRGTILNISSAGAFFAYPYFNIYCATKGFVHQFSKALHIELKDHGIRVLSACPGQIATRFREKAAKGHPQKRDFRTMTEEKAVSYLWRQIEKGYFFSLFDWRTKMMVFLGRLLPDFILNPLLIKGIRSRIKS